MSNPNVRFAGMISCSSGISGGHHGDSERASTDGIIACTSRNRRSHHGYLTNNVRYSHGDPVNSASTSGQLKTVYVGKNQYTVSTIKLAEISDLSWNKKAGFNMLTSSVVSLNGGHSVSYLIMVLENEVLIDTYSVL